MRRSWSTPVDAKQRRRESIAAERANKSRVKPGVTFEPLSHAGAQLNFAQEMSERCRAKPMKAFDMTLPPEPSTQLDLIKGGFCEKGRIVLAAQQRRFRKPVPRYIEGGLRRV
jgi:hypothetical protein